MPEWEDPADAITPNEFRSPVPWMSIAKLELGRKVHEVAGVQDNPRIKDYLACVGLPFDHDETPWCSAFANWCMVRVGILGTNRANARSWLTWGRPLETPVYGCVVVLSRPPDAAHGHVAFYIEQTPTTLVLLGGNQGNAVSIADYPRDRLLSYRWPPHM